MEYQPVLFTNLNTDISTLSQPLQLINLGSQNNFGSLMILDAEDLENLAGKVGLISSNHRVEITGGAVVGKTTLGKNSDLHIELLI